MYLQKHICVLIVEDDTNDAELIKLELTKAGYSVEAQVVDTAEAFQQNLTNNEWDLVISDYWLPSFNGMEALQIFKQSNLDVPFILVSGVIGEEVAVDSVLAGADDYVIKNNIKRLQGAVKRELKSAEERRAKREAEEALIRSETLFRQLFQNAPVGIVLLDVDQKVQEVNQPFVNIFGYSKQELLGTNLNSLIVPDEKQNEALDLSLSIFKGDARQLETYRVTKNGKIRNVLFAGVPAKIHSQVEAAYGIYVDITERVRFEQQLKKSLKEKKVLLAEVHHRVKNNLSVIIGLLSLQIHELEDPEMIKVFQESIDRIKAMATVHEKLYQSDDLGEINLSNYLEELLADISSTYKFDERGIDYEVHGDDISLNLSKIISCGLIVNELVINAYKHAFTENRGNLIRVLVTKDIDGVRLFVQDNGQGLPDNLNFQDTDSLGLNIVRLLTNKLNGSINIKTDDGTHFELTFPTEAMQT